MMGKKSHNELGEPSESLGEVPNERPVARIDPGLRSSADHCLPKMVDPRLLLSTIAGFRGLIKACVPSFEPHRAPPERVGGYRGSFGIGLPFGWSVHSDRVHLAKVPNAHPVSF